MNGEYKEKLPFGKGALIVTKNSYIIQFYFSGLDSRYNGTILNIEKNEIDNYIDAYKENREKYLKLKLMKDQLGNEFSTTGILGMKINIGGPCEGVCIKSYHMPIKTDIEYSSLISSFQWAKQNGPKIMVLLSSI